MPLTVQEQFGQIDIYVFDQILRGNIAAPMRNLYLVCRIKDAGKLNARAVA